MGMLKTKLKKILPLIMAISMVLSITPVSAVEDNGLIEPIEANEMVHYVMTVQWGNVRGDATSNEETNFDGSIMIENNASEDTCISCGFDAPTEVLGRITLIRTLLFEDHDQILIKTPYVSWQSLIYNHWDGLRAVVSAQADANITVKADAGEMTKTAKEFFQSKKPIVVEVENGREIIIKTHPLRRRKFGLIAMWGRTDSVNAAVQNNTVPSEDIQNDSNISELTCDQKCKSLSYASGVCRTWAIVPTVEPGCKVGETGVGYTSDCYIPVSPLGAPALGVGKNCCCQSNGVDFSGRFKINQGGTIKLGRKIKFEKGDEITGLSPTNIDWRSLISTDKDGILVKFNLDKTLIPESTITVSFNGGVNWSKDFNIIELYHQKITKEQITVNGDSNYGLTLSVVGRSNRSLIKVKNKPAVYMIEDDVKKPILSAEVFEENGLDWNEIENVDEDELDSYPEGEPMNYPDGTLVKGSGSAVYVIGDGRKKPVKSAKAFLGLGYKWGQIKSIRDAELNKYEDAAMIEDESVHPEGALIRVKGTAGVYQIKGGKLNPVTSREVFEANKLKWNKVLEVTQRQKNQFSHGEELNYPDGTLIQGEGTETYIIDKGEKRAFESEEDLSSLGYKAKKVIKVQERLLNKLQAGKDMIGR